ncbi:MAG: vitamin K epoxide reductase [Pseudomonadota bacterium]|nr:vitamin K epoxide reductase [Pseudomonadota bacterium]
MAAALHDDSNPSRWPHRLPALLLALAGCGIATYLTLYQTATISHVWEPLFGNGSRRILDSRIAGLLPVPDASLGVMGYLIEAAVGVAGGAYRWHTRPWVVLLYGLIVAAFAVAGVVLVAAQIFYFQTGCTLCLGSALISFGIAAWVWREPVAAFRRVMELRKAGRSWRHALLGAATATHWKGEAVS